MSKLFKFILVISFIVFLPLQTKALSCDPGSASVPGTVSELCNPLAATGGSDFRSFGIHVLQVFAGAAGIVTITYVVFSGFRFMISQGNSEDVEAAKRGLQWSLAGLIVMLLSFVLVSAISIILNVQDVPNDSFTGKPILINPLKGGSNSITTFNGLYLRLLTGFFEILGLLAVFLIIINGYQYITSRGNEEQTEKAKQGIQYAVVGIIVVLLAYVIVRATASFFGAQ